jgi:hypothetical protein
MRHVDRRRGFAVKGGRPNVTNHASDAGGIVRDLAYPNTAADNVRRRDTRPEGLCKGLADEDHRRGLPGLEQPARHE